MALTQARRLKERTYPKFVGEGGRARVVVLAAGVGGRWSEETAQFLRSLAKARSESSPFILQNRVMAAQNPPMERHSGMHCRQVSRFVPAGEAPDSWNWCSRSLSARGVLRDHGFASQNREMHEETWGLMDQAMSKRAS